MIIQVIRKYRQTSWPIKMFIWTTISLMALLIVTTLWAYARLDYARTNIPAVPIQVSP